MQLKCLFSSPQLHSRYFRLSEMLPVQLKRGKSLSPACGGDCAPAKPWRAILENALFAGEETPPPVKGHCAGLKPV